VRPDAGKSQLINELMVSMSPRTVNLKLQFFKGSKAVVAGFGLKHFTFQENIMDKAIDITSKGFL
jgi:hypothetical protein